MLSPNACVFRCARVVSSFAGEISYLQLLSTHSFVPRDPRIVASVCERSNLEHVSTMMNLDCYLTRPYAKIDGPKF